MPRWPGLSETAGGVCAREVRAAWMVEAGEVGRGLMVKSRECRDHRLRLCLPGNVGTF